MGGGSHHPGLPHPHPLTSYWQTPLSEIANHRSTPELPSTADYIVVGTGISGASIATKLISKVPSASIVILEARTVCSGATGRNGGHCAQVWEGFKDQVDELGAEEALKIEQLEVENVANVGAYIKRNGIDCDLEEVDRVDVAVEEDLWEKYLGALRAREELQPRVDRDVLRPSTNGFEGEGDGEIEGEGRVETIAGKIVYHGKAATKFLGIPNLKGAVSHKGWTLSPYKFVNELIRRLLRQGVNLQTTTPVLSVDRIPSTTASSTEQRWTVRTERGSIRTKHVILATNAYTGALLPHLTTSKHLKPTRGQAVAIRPGSKVCSESRIHKGLGLNGYGQGDYMMQRPAGSDGAGIIVYGGGRRLSPTGEFWTTDDSVVNPEIAKYLPDAPAKFWGREFWGSNGKTVMGWTGIMGYTKDERPLVGEMAGDENRGLWVSAGFNGHGMALTFQTAQALVDMITTGKEPEWFPKAYRLSRVPV